MIFLFIFFLVSVLQHWRRNPSTIFVTMYDC